MIAMWENELSFPFGELSLFGKRFDCGVFGAFNGKVDLNTFYVSLRPKKNYFK